FAGDLDTLSDIRILFCDDIAPDLAEVADTGVAVCPDVLANLCRLAHVHVCAPQPVIDLQNSPTTISRSILRLCSWSSVPSGRRQCLCQFFTDSLLISPPQVPVSSCHAPYLCAWFTRSSAVGSSPAPVIRQRPPRAQERSPNSVISSTRTPSP